MNKIDKRLDLPYWFSMRQVNVLHRHHQSSSQKDSISKVSIKLMKNRHSNIENKFSLDSFSTLDSNVRLHRFRCCSRRDSTCKVSKNTKKRSKKTMAKSMFHLIRFESLGQIFCSFIFNEVWREIQNDKCLLSRRKLENTSKLIDRPTWFIFNVSLRNKVPSELILFITSFNSTSVFRKRTSKSMNNIWKLFELRRWFSTLRLNVLFLRLQFHFPKDRVAKFSVENFKWKDFQL